MQLVDAQAALGAQRRHEATGDAHAPEPLVGQEGQRRAVHAVAHGQRAGDPSDAQTRVGLGSAPGRREAGDPAPPLGRHADLGGHLGRQGFAGGGLPGADGAAPRHALGENLSPVEAEVGVADALVELAEGSEAGARGDVPDLHASLAVVGDHAGALWVEGCLVAREAQAPHPGAQLPELHLRGRVGAVASGGEPASVGAEGYTHMGRRQGVSTLSGLQVPDLSAAVAHGDEGVAGGADGHADPVVGKLPQRPAAAGVDERHDAVDGASGGLFGLTDGTRPVEAAPQPGGAGVVEQQVGAAGPRDHQALDPKHAGVGRQRAATLRSEGVEVPVEVEVVVTPL